MAKEWWWPALVWSEVDSHRYRLSEDQARRHQAEPGAFDFSVTGHCYRIVRRIMGQKFQQAVFARPVFAITLLTLSPSAFAYLDPSTGSMVVSALVGIAASIALAAKTYWYKIKRLFRRSNKPTVEIAKDSSADR